MIESPAQSKRASGLAFEDGVDSIAPRFPARPIPFGGGEDLPWEALARWHVSLSSCVHALGALEVLR